jgi:VanZ family protein
LDKLTHFLLYAVEGFLLYRAIAWQGRAAFAPARILAVCGAMAVWGTLDEVHQEWIPGREMEAGDLGSDIAGAVVGATFASLAQPGRRRLPEPKAD